MIDSEQQARREAAHKTQGEEGQGGEQAQEAFEEPWSPKEGWQATIAHTDLAAKLDKYKGDLRKVKPSWLEFTVDLCDCVTDAEMRQLCLALGLRFTKSQTTIDLAKELVGNLVWFDELCGLPRPAKPPKKPKKVLPMTPHHITAQWSLKTCQVTTISRNIVTREQVEERFFDACKSGDTEAVKKLLKGDPF